MKVDIQIAIGRCRRPGFGIASEHSLYGRPPPGFKDAIDVCMQFGILECGGQLVSWSQSNDYPARGVLVRRLKSKIVSDGGHGPASGCNAIHS